jgi:hypothetical protein
MAKGEIGNDRDVEIGESIAEDFFDAKTGDTGGRIALTEPADRNSGQLGECASESPVGEQSIDPIGSFGNIFDRQDGTSEIWLEGSPEQVGSNGEITWQEFTSCYIADPWIALEWREWLPSYKLK